VAAPTNRGIVTDADRQQGHNVVRDLNVAFDLVNGHEVQPTPSANLAIAMNEIRRLLLSPEVKAARVKGPYLVLVIE
jgi:hypothetical protein